MTDHSHNSEYMRQTEMNRLIEMFQRSLASLGATTAALDAKLDTMILTTAQIPEIKATLQEMDGEQKGLKMWKSQHERDHELTHAEEHAYREGRDSVIGQIGWGWKALGAALALAVVAGEAYRLVESL